MKTIRYIALFLLTAVILISSFIAAARIPRSAIEKNTVRSAEQLSQKAIAFQTTFAGLESSKVDNYADAVLLSIAWHMDPAHPLQSIAWAKYYTEDRYDYNGLVYEYFLHGIQENKPANQQYLRYWHGSIVTLKPLLLFLDLGGIHAFHGLLLIALTVWLVTLLVGKGYGKEAICLLISFIAVDVWFVPQCMFLCTLAASLITVYWTIGGKERKLPDLFLIVGMIAVFLDFFTTETLTIAIPMLLMLRIRKNAGKEKGNISLLISCCLLWGAGYIGMWLMKWGFSAMVLHRNVMPYVQHSIVEHVQNMRGTTVLTMKLRTLAANIKLLFPLEYGLYGKILLLILIAVFVAYPVLTDRIRLCSACKWKWIVLYLCAGSLPILRFLIISNHSLVHAFFVHRALASTVMAAGMISMEILQKNNLKEKEGTGQWNTQ